MFLLSREHAWAITSVDRHSQMRAVRSELAPATYLPSGLKATPLTTPP